MDTVVAFASGLFAKSVALAHGANASSMLVASSLAARVELKCGLMACFRIIGE
jgi:hypothetical protein